MVLRAERSACGSRVVLDGDDVLTGRESRDHHDGPFGAHRQCHTLYPHTVQIVDESRLLLTRSRSAVYLPDMHKLGMLVVVFFVALPLAAAAQTLQWVVRDRDGGLVGPVLLQGAGGAGPGRLTDDSLLWVARRIPGGWLRIPVTKSTVWATNQFPFLYEAQDCSGPALLEAPQEKDEVLATVIFDINVYWSAGPAESRVIRAKGILVRDPDGCQGALLESGLCCSTLGDEETHLAAEVSGARVTDLRLRPPFRLERVAPSSE